MRRREFITLVGCAAAWPLAARAQQLSAIIGFLSPGSPEQQGGFVTAFRKGLSEGGYVEGRNVAIEYRWAEGENDQLPELAAELVRRKVSVIFTAGSAPAALAAKSATSTIPVVFFTGSDPVQTGLVESLRHPGGNLTGITNLNVELGSKRLELLHEAVSAARRIGFLINPSNSATTKTILRNMEAAGRALGVEVSVLNVSSEHEFDSAFATLSKMKIDALAITADALFTNRRKQLAVLSMRFAIPAIYQTREFVATGGLMSYGAVISEGYRLGGVYTSRILKGEKPADLPVQQSTKIELILNLKTARTLGVSFPLSLLGRADEVIE
jgi:putative ABC transport system substrate-binding protein